MYVSTRRGGVQRFVSATRQFESVPALPSYGAFAVQADDKVMSTTMAFVRLLGNLLKEQPAPLVKIHAIRAHHLEHLAAMAGRRCRFPLARLGIEAPTLDKLARKIGVDPATLAATVSVQA